MEGSRERSSGQPIARAEEIPTAIDEVLNRIKVTLNLKSATTIFCPDNAKGVRGDDGEPGRDPHQDHHGQLHHCNIWGHGEKSHGQLHRFNIFAVFL